jgi:hypothetical protein
MEILVDYNNVRSPDRNRGVTYVVDRILATLGYSVLSSSPRVHFRLYDGWYLDRTPTRHAQSVATEILATFPLTRTISDGTTPLTLIVNAELAYSLKIDPGTHLWHTYRRRGYPQGLGCHNPATVGCTNSSCALVPMHSFFRSQSCPVTGCGIIASQLIFKNEQKLVDTMLTADLLYLYMQKAQRVGVVSSDDDMWPAIKTVLELGMQVFHVHTLPGYRTPVIYSRGPRPSYTELCL